MYYLIHTIYRPCQIFQRYIFTRSRGHERMVRDMACGEDSKRTFQAWSMVIIARRKTTKGKRFVWKQPFTAEGKFWIQCCQPCHKPQDIRGLALLTSCNQVHLPNSVHQGKVTADQFFVVILGDQTWASATFSFRKICARFPLQPEHLVW